MMIRKQIPHERIRAAAGVKLISIICVILLFACNKKAAESNYLKKDTTVFVDKVNTKDKAKIEESLLELDLNNQNERTIEEYKLYIDNAKIIQEDLSIKSIDVLEKLIPRNDQEFLCFYSLSYPKSGNIKLYNKLNTLFFDSALNDKGELLELFSNLSEFVDVEYAESFFDEIDLIVNRNPTKFCEIFKNLSKISQLRLIEKKDVCINK